MILQLQGYDFDIEYVKSEKNISVYNSCLSDRGQKVIESTMVDKYVNFVTFTAFTLEDIKTATKQDKFL